LERELKPLKMIFQTDKNTLPKLAESLNNLLQNLSENPESIARICEFIFTKYSEKHRAYHNLSHINALLSHAENYQEKFLDFESVQLAIWFHDVIYNTKRFDNESESAKIAVEVLSELNVPKDKIEKIDRMITATAKHDSNGLDVDGKLFLDLDLAILGQNENVYLNYSKAIRKEYSFVPWFLYKRSRRKILENFLQREIIYFTEEIRQDFETQARLNLANEIKTLS
jgi:predicted metal-dependent HD superfamily phosphohydrolase